VASHPQILGATQLTPKRFNGQCQEVLNAFEVLEKSIARLEDTFLPVINPFCPQPCDPIAGQESKNPPQSEFDNFIQATFRRLSDLANDINDLCDRSAV
jgi:hypothetical protein